MNDSAILTDPADNRNHSFASVLDQADSHTSTLTKKRIYFSEQEDAEIIEQGYNIKTCYKIAKLLEKRPCLIGDIRLTLGYDERTITKYLSFLIEIKKAKMVRFEDEHTLIKWVYFAHPAKKYHYDFENDSLSDIPEFFWYEIPIIKKWYNRVIDNQYQQYHIKVFLDICSGQVVKSFSINPSKWVHEATTEQFYEAYKAEHKRELHQYQVDAIRAFYNHCLKIPLTKATAESLGLDQKQIKGKYAEVKLTKEEIQQAERWLETEGIELAKQYGLEPERLLAHYGITSEAFPRPSSTFWIETKSIEQHAIEYNGQHAVVLHWFHYESKQRKRFPKLMLDAKLIRYTSDWIGRRFQYKYKFLFLDDDEFTAAQYTTETLRKVRQPYIKIYRAMFSAIGHDEAPFSTDPLYACRHFSAQKWIDRLGMEAAFVVAKMGWTDFRTFEKFYGSPRPVDVLDYILNRKDDTGNDLFQSVSILISSEVVG